MLTTYLASQIPGQLGWGHLAVSPTHCSLYAARITACPSPQFRRPLSARACTVPARGKWGSGRFHPDCQIPDGVGRSQPPPGWAISCNLTPWGSTSPQRQQKRPPCTLLPSPPPRQLSPSPPALPPAGTRVHTAGWKTTSQSCVRLQLGFFFSLLAEISAGSVPKSSLVQTRLVQTQGRG